MSREIKFRAWDSLAKKFKYGSRVIDHYTNWEQSVGVKDKNGKEIYEGDILRLDSEWYYGHPLMYLSFNNDRLCFILKEVENEYINYDFKRNTGKDFEVVGNIHENLELLMVKNETLQHNN